MAKVYERYAIIRIADDTDDQQTAAAIDQALVTSVTQEDLQVFFLSQMKRIIWGNSPGHWYEDFIAQGVPSLNDVISGTGAVQCIDLPIGASPTVISDTVIPSGAIVVNTMVRILGAYPSGVTVEVGQSGATSLLQGSADNTAQVAGNLFEAPQRTFWGGTSLPVLVSLAGGVLSGYGSVTVEWVVPTD